MAYDRKPNRYGGPKQPAPQASRPVPPPPPPPGPAADVETFPRDAFAGAGRRLWAFLLDCLIVMPTMLAFAWIMGTFPGQNAADAESVGLFGVSMKTAKLITKIVQILLYDIYFTATLHRWGGTWGMKFSGIIVLGRDFAMPSKSQARGRYWANILSVLPLGLGVMAILWDKHRRAWHDRIVGTYVLRMAVTPGTLVEAATRRTRDPKESDEDAATALKGLMWFILITFAPGLIVLGLTRLLLGKVGIIKSKPKS